jgi:CPA2 family monovalent cation:H+ antiporter-2
LPLEGQSLVLAGALISIGANPAIFAAIEPLQRWMRAHSAMARQLEQRADPLAQLPTSTEPSRLAGQVVLVGFGRVGKRIATTLRQQQIPFVVAEQNRGLVDALRKDGLSAVSGDAATPDVLIQAHIAQAALLVIAIANTVHVRKMVAIAKALNPAISVVVRTHNEEEATLLSKEGAVKVFLGEQELAHAMAAHILLQLQKQPPNA